MGQPLKTPRSGRLHYAWIVAGVTFLTLLAASASRSASGVLIIPLGNEFQWSRATVSSIVSLNILLFGLVGPFAAALYQRIGLRRTMLLGMTLIGGGYALSTLARHYWQFLLSWGVMVGLGAGMVAIVLGAAVTTRWFTARRGLVVGVLTASTATGQLVFLPLMASIATHHGWRGVPWVVTGATAAALPLIWFLMRDDPAELGLRPYGETGEVVAVKPATGNPARQAVVVLIEAARSRDFWLLAGSFFICGATTNGLVGTHLLPAAFDCGIPEVRAAGLLALMGLFDLAGTTLSGWLSDRHNTRYLLFTYYGLRGLSLFFLPTALVGPSAGLLVFAIFYGLDWIATVPPTVRLTADVFGREKAGIVFGWVVAAHQLGAAFATSAAGVLRTTTGSYTLAFVGAGALCLIAALGVLPVGRTLRARAVEAAV